MELSLKTYIFLLFTLFYFISCKDNTPSTALLKQAGDEAFANPAHAVELLESIENPNEMDKEDYMQYIVTLVQAKYNNDQDITGDSLITVAQKYFSDKNNPEATATASFYAGTVYHANKIPGKAFEYFLFSERYSKLAKNKPLEAKSLHFQANLYYEQNMMDSASTHYREALAYYGDKAESVSNRLKALSGIGRSYEITNNLDSATHYFSKALELAIQADNKEYRAIETNNLGFILLREKRYGKAKEYFSEAIQESPSTVDSLKIFLNYSLLYNQTQQLDSAKYYIDLINNRLPNIKDNQLLVSIYGSMSDYYQQTGDFTKALHYKDMQVQANQKIIESRSIEKVLNADSKYQLYLQEHKAERKFFILLQITVVILMVLVFMFCRKRKYKKLKILEEKVHSLTQDRLFENSIASKSYLENVYEHFIIGWSEIEVKVNHILLTGREEIGIEIYIEIKAMVDALKKQTNQQLLLVAKDYLSSDLFLGKKLSATLSDHELVILMLCHLDYSEEAIAFIIDSRGDTLNLADIKWNIERKLHQAGMNDFNINALLYPE